MGTENLESNTKRCKQEESNGNENDSVKGIQEEDNTNNNDNNNNNKTNSNNKDNSKPPEPPKDYIHVRARRGQATDSHSLAERVRILFYYIPMFMIYMWELCIDFFGF